MMNYYIVGGGDFDRDRFRPDPKDCVLAADAGFAVLNELNIDAHAVVGDFDSLGSIPDHNNILRFPKEKDETDMALCTRIAEERGADCIHLFGGTGGRMDHTLGNLALIADLSRRGIAAYLYGLDFTAAAVTNGSLVFPKEYQGTVSVFCHGNTARGVNIRGLYYEVTDAALNPFVSLGVSNEFTGTSAEISVEAGTLLVLWQDRNGTLPAFRQTKSE